MSNYRLYRLDGAGRITAAEWLESSDDDSARRAAAERVDSGAFELWDQERLVERMRIPSKR